MIQTVEASLEELRSVAETIKRSVPENAVIFLRGDLAAGKTTLAKALAEVLGYKEAVTSPTFSIQQVYGDRLYHYDLYQCPNEKFMAMGLLESLEEPGWHLVEWGDEALRTMLREYGFDTAVVEITQKEDGGRRYRIETDA
ncbi:tRNA (adenosine(37)-N6)-threonylcarbamoyltransferase complex ATPase subunit type 1 TsaE [Hydrogenimonas sp.]